MKSTFKSDLQKEQKLSVLLDGYYAKTINHYTIERVSDIKNQLAGIDLIFTHKTTQTRYYIDEKAQLDYINEDLPTFAFELRYLKSGKPKDGWVYDTSKKTDFYALVTGIYSDEPEHYTSCKITLVNRKKLLSFLNIRNIDSVVLNTLIENEEGTHGKVVLPQLKSKSEGYLYFSSRNKAEKPINLILKLDFLIANGLAKRLI